jgi:hypothetical protein
MIVAREAELRGECVPKRSLGTHSRMPNEDAGMGIEETR